MSLDLIDDPKKGIEYCNKNIQDIEKDLAEASTPNDKRILRNQLLGFTELLEKFIHQSHQQGYDTEDVAKGAPKMKSKRGKVRFDAD